MKETSHDIAANLGLDGKHARQRRFRRWWMFILLFVLAGLGARMVLGRKPQELNYVTVAIERGDLVVTVGATGRLEPLKQVDVGIEVSGTILSVEVDDNDYVEVGQPLAQIDTTRLEAVRDQSEAALASARAMVLQSQANVKEAEARLARLKRVYQLSGGKAPSQDELDAAEALRSRVLADEASASASVQQAQATLNVNLTDLSKAIIRSPINGVVLTRLVEPGQTVAATFQAPVLMTLAEDLSQMELRVDVDEADIGLVREGQTATFTVDAYPERTFQANITQVHYGSLTVEGVVTYTTILRVDNSALLLRPGMTATADIVVSEHRDLPLVINKAFRFSPTQSQKSKRSRGLVGAILPKPPFGDSKPIEEDSTGNTKKVWLLEQGQPVPHTIRIGESDGLRSEIVDETLREGDLVIVGMETAKSST